MRKGYILLLSVSVLLISSAFFGGCSLLPQEEELLPPKLTSAAEVIYSTEKVKVFEVLEKGFSGKASVRSFNNSTVLFDLGGTIKTKDAMYNTKVKKGDVLAVLSNADDYSSNIVYQKSNIQVLENEIKLAELNMNGGGQAALYLIEYEKAQYDLQILENGGTLSDGTTLEGQRIKAEMARVVYENHILSAQIDYEQKSFQLQSQRQNLAQSEADYERCFVRAPISGTIIYSTDKAPGDWVASGDTLVIISPSGNARLAFSGTEMHSQFLSVGTTVSVTLTDPKYAGRYTGVVMQTPETQPADAKYGEKYLYLFDINGLDLSNADLIGLEGTISIVSDSRENVLAVPNYLIQESVDLDTSEAYYFVLVLEDKMPVTRMLELGLRTDSHSEIISGLSEGDAIILS